MDWKRLRKNFHYYKKYVDPVFLLVAIFGAIFLLILIVAKKKEVRYPTTAVIAICCLLLADIAYLICQLLVDFGELHVIPVIQHQSEYSCYAFVGITGAFLTMQGYVQAVISAERFLAVTKPLKVKTLFTKQRIVGLLCAATLVSAGVGVGYVYFGFQYAEHPKVESVMVCMSQPNGWKMAVFMLLTWFLPPAIITLICTIGIIKTLLNRNSITRKDNTQRLQSTEKRLSLMLVVMNFIFILTAIPMSVCYSTKYFYRFHRSYKISLFWDLSVFCTRFGAFTDWIIILLIGSQLRKALKKMIRKEKAKTSSVCSQSTSVDHDQSKIRMSTIAS